MYDTARQRLCQAASTILPCRSFNDYLKYYGNTELAPNAQFYIAMIHFAQGNYETAVKEFDMVLEKYPDNNKTADALLYKGRALVKMPATRPMAPTNSWKSSSAFPRATRPPGVHGTQSARPELRGAGQPLAPGRRKK